MAKMAKNSVLTIIGCYPIVSQIFPKEGEMALRKLNHRLNLGLSKGGADLKKHVSIYPRKQIRQKREGLSASQL